jgi:hypothetical protein
MAKPNEITSREPEIPFIASPFTDHTDILHAHYIWLVKRQSTLEINDY